MNESILIPVTTQAQRDAIAHLFKHTRNRPSSWQDLDNDFGVAS